MSTSPTIRPIFVNSSIHEVAVTLIEALIIVMCVIFAFLGSPRSVLIPVVAIPLSLVGTLAIMLALGFSINLLTLLALVLAIGLGGGRCHHRGRERQSALGRRHAAARPRRCRRRANWPAPSSP